MGVCFGGRETENELYTHTRWQGALEEVIYISNSPAEATEGH